MRIHPHQERDYVKWLVDKTGLQFYKKLCTQLHDIRFVYQNRMDENRESDGRAMRQHFGHEIGLTPSEITAILDQNDGCSMLEMMVALALRIEEQIMADDAEGDRTGVWFYAMIVSLGLDGYDDKHYNPVDVQEIINRFEAGEYMPSGRGGLFTVVDPTVDMRNLEIWYQAMRYLNTLK